MKIKKFKSTIFDIQENGLISHPELGEGRFIPSLVVNSFSDNKLKELIKIHQDTPPGDTVTYWSRPASLFKTKIWHLHIEFSQPMTYKFRIAFKLNKQYSLIDAIFISQATYLSVGNKGDKVSEMKNEMILVEIPEIKETRKVWERTLNEVLKDIIRKTGVPKKQVKIEIKKHKSEMRKLLLLDKNTAPNNV
jgi:hypothetical protein